MRHDDPQEQNKRYFRSDTRIFMQDGAWFFSAREGDVGPFPSREHAIDEMSRYVKLARMHSDSDLERMRHQLTRARDEKAGEATSPGLALMDADPVDALEFDLVPMSPVPAACRR